MPSDVCAAERAAPAAAPPAAPASRPRPALRAIAGGRRDAGARPSGLSWQGLVFGNPLYPLTLGRSAPRRLNTVPADPWPGNRDRAIDLLDGVVVLQGERVETNRPLWFPTGVGEPFLMALHGFEWLRDLKALGGDQARRLARIWVADWIDRCGRWDAVAWRPEVIGGRVASWLGAHDFFCDSAEDEFRRLVFASLARQVRHLARVAPIEAEGPYRLITLKGLILGALALDDTPRRLAPAVRALVAWLDTRIGADGIVPQRNALVQLGTLRHLVDIRTALTAARVPVPGALQTAIERMGPALRFFRHADGRLCLFNASAAMPLLAPFESPPAAEPLLVDTALTRSDAKGRPVRSAIHTGFERISATRTLICFDGGPPAREGFDRGAHAAPFAFEMSIGRDRMIVSCGPWIGRRTDTGWATALRGAAAHSTLALTRSDPWLPVEAGGIARRPGLVRLDRFDQAEGTLIDAEHDGYRAGFGLVARRLLFVARAGDDIRGEDRFAPAEGGPPAAPGQAFAIRFHLHPRVSAVRVHGGGAILLKLPGGVGWRFRASGPAGLGLEDSVYFGDGEQRRTAQIVLSGQTGSDGATVKWVLQRERKR